jgi:hypothetical protein
MAEQGIEIVFSAATDGLKKGVAEAVTGIKQVEKASEEASRKGADSFTGFGETVARTVGDGSRGATGALLGLINPANLAATAVASLGAALVAYATSGSDRLLSLNQVMDRHAQAIKSLGAAYPEALKGLDKLAKESDAVIETRLLGNIANLEEKLAQMSSNLVSKLGSVGASLNSLSFEFGGVVEQSAIADKQFKAFQGALDGLFAGIQSGNPDINKFNSEVSRIAQEAGNTPQILRLAGDVLELGKQALETSGDLQVAMQMLRNWKNEASGAADATRTFNSAIQQLKSLDPTKISALVQAETAYKKALADTNLDLVQRKEIFDQYMKTIDGINKAEAAKQKPAAGGAAPVDDGMSAQMERRLQFIKDSTLGEEQLLIARYERNRLLLQEAFAIEMADSMLQGDERAALKAQQNATLEALDAKHQQNLARMRAAADALMLNNLGSTFGNIGSIIESGGKRGTAAAKAMYIAQALMSTFAAATQAMANPMLMTPFSKFAAYAAVATKGLAAVASIAKAGGGGGGGGGGAAGAGAGAGAATASAPSPTTTFQFTMSNDPMGFGEKFARQFIDQLNSTQRNGGQIRGVIA